MYALTTRQLTTIRTYLQQSGVEEVLLPELLDHLACDLQEAIWEGQTFDEAMMRLCQEADAETLELIQSERQELLAMTPEQLRIATLDDIVFEHRNKQYGAYDLRRFYSQSTNRALWLGIGLFAAGLLAPTLYARLKPASAPDAYMTETTLTDIQTEKLEEPPVVIPPAPEIPVHQPTVRLLPPEVVADAPEETEVPTVEELEKATPSDKTQEGDLDAEVIEAPTETVAPAPVEKALEVERNTDMIMVVVEQQPQFPGGNKALAEFLQKNLQYPSAASRANITGKVFMSFVVDTDGSITQVSVLKGIGFGCDEEASRVVKKMPKWQPGKQQGRAVRVKYNLPISFTLE